MTLTVSESFPVELVLDARARLGEGPVFDLKTGLLLWIDIFAEVVHRYDPESGVNRSFPVGQPVGFVAPRAGGGAIVGLRDGIAAIDPTWSELTMLAPVAIDEPKIRFNDGSCDARGRLFAGTTDSDGAPNRGALYRYTDESDPQIVVAPGSVSNGIDWSPDGRWMYYIDTPTRRVDRFAYDLSSGVLGERTTFLNFLSSDTPDGCCVDGDGYLWIAFIGAWCVRRYDPLGRLDQTVHLPTANVTACAFGGSGLSDLYVTTARDGLSPAELARQPHAGGLFRVVTNVTGRGGAVFGRSVANAP